MKRIMSAIAAHWYEYTGKLFIQFVLYNLKAHYMAYSVSEDGSNYKVVDMSNKKKVAVFDSFKKAISYCSKLVNKGILRI